MKTKLIPAKVPEGAREVYGYEGSGYYIDKLGTMYSTRILSTGAIMTPRGGRHGYLRVGLRYNGKYMTCRVHSLVLETFVGPRPEGYVARHLDGNKLNNSLENLVWGTSEENNGLDKKRHGTASIGSKHGRSKLNEANIIEIRKLLKQGVSLSRVGSIFGVTKGLVGQIARHEIWTHVKET